MDWATFLTVLALLLQGAITIALVWYLGFIRVPMIMRGEVKIGEIALSRKNWPEREQKVSNALDNQFQLPVLFYVAVVAATLTGAIWLDAVLAWAFVLSRSVHLVIHITDNHVVRRFWAYAAGLAILTVFWVELAIRFVIAAVAFGIR